MVEESSLSTLFARVVSILLILKSTCFNHEKNVAEMLLTLGTFLLFIRQGSLKQPSN